MWVAMDSLVSQAAKVRYMFGGPVNLPIVYRASMYYGGSMAGHHSDRPYPIFMHIPGFKVVFPSNSYDGKGLMKTAIWENDPVVVCEDRTILDARGHVTEEDYTITLGVADIKREGTDVTIVAIGGMVPLALDAAGVQRPSKPFPAASSPETDPSPPDAPIQNAGGGIPTDGESVLGRILVDGVLMAGSINVGARHAVPLR